MIIIDNITKQYSTREGPRTVLDNIYFQVSPGEKVGILGRNGAGKSTLIRLISGVELPDGGRIHRGMRISWPLAFSGGFQGSLTGLDNIRFICRVYDADIKTAIAYVEDFSELGVYLREPVKKYSTGMRARLAFGISMAIEFDCYLIDEVMAVGDSRFRKRCQQELFGKRGDRAMILVSHASEQMKTYCRTFYVLNEGHIHKFDDIESANDFYSQSQN